MVSQVEFGGLRSAGPAALELGPSLSSDSCAIRCVVPWCAVRSLPVQGGQLLLPLPALNRSVP